MVGPDDGDERGVDGRFGWLLVGLGFLLLVVLWGTVFTFTVYARPLGDAFGLTTFQTQAVFSVGTAAFFLVGGSVGVLVSGIPLRPVLVAAGLAVAVGVGLLQVAGSFLGLTVAFVLVGVAGGTTFVVTISLVPQWFDRYQGTAMGVTVAGNGLGVQVMPFVWLWLFGRVTVRRAFLVVGVAGVLLLLVAALVYRRPPGRRHRHRVAVDGRWFRSMLTDGRVLASWVGLVLAWGWYFVLSSGLVDILVRAGIAQTVAATAFGLVGGISIASRVASGGLADRVGPRSTFATGVVLAALGLFVLAVAASTTTMYVALVTFGAGLGAIAALYPPIVIRAFGPEHATAVTGLFTYCSAVAGFLTPLGVNALSTSVGGYATPLVALGALTLLGAGLFYWGTDPTT